MILLVPLERRPSVTKGKIDLPAGTLNPVVFHPRQDDHEDQVDQVDQEDQGDQGIKMIRTIDVIRWSR